MSGLCGKTAIISVVIIALIGYSPLRAQVSITGTVTDGQGAALEGVTVSLAGEDIVTVTDAQGRYSLTGDVVARSPEHRGPLARATRLRIHGSVASFVLHRAARVTVELFDMSGRLVHRPVDGVRASGPHALSLMPARIGRGCSLGRSSLDGARESSALLSVDSRLGTIPPSSPSPSPSQAVGAHLATAAAAVDTLKAAKMVESGCLYHAQAIDSYTGTYDIVLSSTPPADQVRMTLRQWHAVMRRQEKEWAQADASYEPLVRAAGDYLRHHYGGGPTAPALYTDFMNGVGGAIYDKVVAGNTLTYDEQKYYYIVAARMIHEEQPAAFYSAVISEGKQLVVAGFRGQSTFTADEVRRLRLYRSYLPQGGNPGDYKLRPGPYGCSTVDMSPGRDAPPRSTSRRTRPARSRRDSYDRKGRASDACG